MKRRAIVRQHPGFKTKHLCGQFDYETVQIPEPWIEDFGVKSWAESYSHPKLRQRIDSMISKDRKTDE